MKNLVLYFFWLILGVYFNLTPYIIHKRSRFSEIFLEKGFKFVPYKGSGPVTFNPGLILLLVEVDPIPKE